MLSDLGILKFRRFAPWIVLSASLMACLKSPDSNVEQLGDFVSRCSANFIEFGMFCRAIEKAGLKEKLNGTTKHTIFIPLDSGMRAFFTEKGFTEATFLNDVQLLPFVQRHISEGKYPPSSLRAGSQLPNLAQGTLTFQNLPSGRYSVNGAKMNEAWYDENEPIINGQIYTLETVVP